MYNTIPPMNKFLTSFIIVVCFATSTFAQDSVFSNFLDTSVQPNKAIYTLWTNYISVLDDREKASKYWEESEVRRYAGYDILRNWECGGTFSKVSHTLKIKQLDSNIYELKIGMGFADSNSSALLSIVKFIVKRKGSDYKLSNYLSYNTKNWKIYRAGWLTFHYPSYYPINIADAKKSEAFLEKIFRSFDIKPYQIDFYASTGLAEVQEAAGFESYISDGVQNKGGCFHEKNHLIFSGGGFYYPHELVHVINASFPNAHQIFLSGFSALLGGHWGKPLPYHQKRLQQYLHEQPGSVKDLIDFNYMDTHTNPQYLIGGLFCEEAIRIGGYEKLKKLFSYGNKEEDFYRAIEKEFNLTKEQAVAFFLEKMKDDKIFAKYDTL